MLEVYGLARAPARQVKALMVTPPIRLHPDVVSGFRRYAAVAAGLMLAIGGLVLTGWTLGIAVLTTPVPRAPGMAADAAAAFIVAGIALSAFLHSQERRSWLSVLASLVVLVSGLRMPQPAGLGFIVLGLLGVLANAGNSRLLTLVRDAGALLLLGIALIGMATYGFFLGGGTVTAMSFDHVTMPTAVLFLLATLGWMSANPERGMTRIAVADSIGGAFARRLLLPTLLLPLLFAYGVQLLQHCYGCSEPTTAAFSAVFTGGAVASLIWWVAHLMDRVEREQRETQRMRDSAETDGLTSLPNRRAFDHAVAMLLRGHRERDACFCLLMLDLDFFKHYNDDFGHLAGDDALRVTARLLREALRPGDLPARYGGEEFAVLLPGSDGENGLQIAGRILELFRAEHWPLRPVTISIGVAPAHRGDEAVDLIARADSALYEAKHSGRDRAVLARVALIPAA